MNFKKITFFICALGVFGLNAQTITNYTTTDGLLSDNVICVDVDDWKEIFEYINQDAKHKKKFKYICGIILDGHRNTDIYDKENINDKCKDVTAMKFFKGNDNCSANFIF